MANPKKGFKFFPVDTDRYQDIRIKRLKKDNGCDGIAVYDYILNEIFRVEGYFLVWDERSAFNVAEYYGLKETKVQGIVSFCAAVGLFDKALLSRGVITSASIQQRYLEMCSRAKRKDISILPEYCLLENQSSGIIGDSSGIMRDSSGSLPQSKVKYKETSLSRGKESPPLPEVSASVPIGLEECYGLLHRNASWQESVIMNMHLSGYKSFTQQELDESLIRFFSNLKAEGTQSKTVPDAQSHFVRWLKFENRRNHEADRTAHSRKQEANDYALRQLAAGYSYVADQVPDIF